jgi:isopenicillin-N N-acyltransferase-like protein
MGYRIHTYSPDADSPTGQVADREVSATYDDEEAVRDFARRVDVVTFEFENVPSATVETAARYAPVRPSGAVLHTTHDSGLETLAFSEAGIFGGKIGLNSAGLGLAINGLVSADDDWARLATPFHVRCYEVLRSSDLAQAEAILAEPPRACSANFLLAQTPDRVLDLESAPTGLERLACQDGRLVHANHFLHPERLGLVEPQVERRPSSIPRQARLEALLAAQQPITKEQIAAALRDHQDHPYGICRHLDLDEPPEERCLTVTSAIMDLDARSLLISDGQPCTAPYQEFSLAAGASWSGS